MAVSSQTLFPSRLKNLRQTRQLRQWELAKDIEVCRGAISHYERGVREPEYYNLVKIADFFGVSIDYLLGRSEE